MVKKFVIKPWMIIVASVVVIGGVSLFFVLNKNPTDNKSSPSVNKKSYISPQEHNDYWRETNKKREEAKEAEEQCKQEDHPTEKKRKYKSCDEKEEVEAEDEEVEKEKVKEEQKTKKPMTQSRLKALRKKYQRQAKQLVSNKRRKGIPHCAAGGKKGDTNQNGYKMMKYGCKECEKGYFLDEDGKCQSSAAECNDPRHIADENGQLITDDMADKLLKEKKQKLKCICPHIHPSAQGTMYRYKDGMCQRKFKTKTGFRYKDSFKKGYEDVYATNEEKKKAVNDKKLHPDFLKDSNFYQEEGEVAKDYKGNVIEWEKDIRMESAWNRGDKTRSREEQKYAKEINDMMKNNGVVEGKFYKKVGDKIINTNFGDKDKSVFYINAGGLCYPNKGKDKNISRFCGNNSGWFNDDAEKKEDVPKFYKMKDGQKVETDKNDNDPSVFYYAGSGVTCFPNDPAKKGTQSSLCSSNLSGGFINMDKQGLTDEQKQQLERNKVIKKVVNVKTKDNFVITPDCVF